MTPPSDNSWMKQSDFHHLGQYLKELRLKAGLTQTELAIAINLHSQFVSNWERGQSAPPSHCFQIVLDILQADRDKVVKLMVLDSKKIIEAKVFNQKSNKKKKAD